MIVGIPKEIMTGERRVSASPDTVKKMVADGFSVIVQKDAGEASYYHDDAYIKNGAIIEEDVVKLYKAADVILKVKEPEYNKAKNLHELDMMHQGQYLITFLHPAAPANHEMVRKMAEVGVIGLTLDGIPRISRAQSMDALSSMSTCAGYKGMLMAANEISLFMPMIGSAVGMIKPATVFVIGAGVAGLRAIATAKGLGAQVYASDVRPDAVEQAKSLGARIVETGVPVDVALSSDGVYAKSLPDDILKMERDKLREIISRADIVFASALVPGKEAPILIDEEMVKAMKPGSVIVDVSIDQGGNCSITTAGKKTVEYGVIIEGMKNIPGMIPNSSTWMFSLNIYNLLKYLVRDGNMNLDLSDEITKSILVTHNNKIVHTGTLEAMKLI